MADGAKPVLPFGQMAVTIRDAALVKRLMTGSTGERHGVMQVTTVLDGGIEQTVDWPIHSQAYDMGRDDPPKELA